MKINAIQHTSNGVVVHTNNTAPLNLAEAKEVVEALADVSGDAEVMVTGKRGVVLL